jgi:hypothetical protein
MPDQMIVTSSDSSALPDRTETLLQVRAELRDNHPRLTDIQIDLIADVACELRLAQIRIGMLPSPTPPQPVSSPASPEPVRMRVPALVGDTWESRVGA